MSLIERITRYQLSSGGSAMYDDDRNPGHLLYLVARAFIDLCQKAVEEHATHDRQFMSKRTGLLFEPPTEDLAKCTNEVCQAVARYAEMP